MGWNDGWHDGWGVGGWIVMALMMLLFWGGLIVLVVVLARAILASGRSTDRRSPERDADQVLAERFARGEIDEEEYEHRRQVLHSHARRST